jgi:mRNA-degrading endonuclease RelE of RelBE toxin-antitoxin system
MHLSLTLLRCLVKATFIGVRFGKFRALFKVYENEKTIVIVKIDHRKRIYR